MSTATTPLLRLGKGTRRLLDQVWVYLPLALMGLLALGSYWLQRATPTPAPPPVAHAPAHEPDYFMRGFSVRTYDADGRLKHEVFGAEARHYPDTGSTEIDNARIRSFTPEGRLTVATAERVTADADQNVYVLTGRAEVVQTGVGSAKAQQRPRLTFRSDHMRLFSREERVVSERPVVLQRGNDHIEAGSLRYDNKTGIADLQGRVRAVLLPRP